MDDNVILDTSALEGMMAELIQAISKLDLSIDYLSGIMGGEDPAIIGATQGAYGRAAGAPTAVSMIQPQVMENSSSKNEFIKSIVKEEVLKFLSENN